MQKGLRFKPTLVVFFSTLVLALAGCGGDSGSRSSSEAEPSPGSPTEATSSTAAATEPATDEETPPTPFRLPNRPSTKPPASTLERRIPAPSEQPVLPVGMRAASRRSPTC